MVLATAQNEFGAVIVNDHLTIGDGVLHTEVPGPGGAALAAAMPGNQAVASPAATPLTVGAGGGGFCRRSWCPRESLGCCGASLATTVAHRCNSHGFGEIRWKNT
eukprot:GABV01001506.1.p2 GENE.GABV01001506.1~~GABV01001506.1.p2  ORF type:complete len:105 (-),score=28.11 GABV01001506.1:18-332(-)